MKVLAVIANKLLLGLGLVVLATDMVAQTKPAPAFKPNPRLNEQGKRGEYLWLQRCALCHNAKLVKEGPVGTTLGPSLEGVLNGADEAREKNVREYILKGSPKMPSGGQKMPGFQYDLEASQMDDLIAYVKTL